MTAKEKIFQSIEEKKEQYIQASDHIWEYAETSFREYRSSRELTEILEKEGFTVEKGIAGIPTVFRGTYGKGSPVIGILGEYDALAGLSQKGSVAVREAAMPGGNGHGCGLDLASIGNCKCFQRLNPCGHSSGSKFSRYCSSCSCYARERQICTGCSGTYECGRAVFKRAYAGKSQSALCISGCRRQST